VTDAERWLRRNAADAPPALLDAMLGALSADAGEAVPDALAAGALRLYHALLRTSGGREDALPLLAADALLTHSLQAQAEIDPDGVDAFSRRWGAAGALSLLSPDAPRA
jgi:GAF domain-containing protein